MDSKKLEDKKLEPVVGGTDSDVVIEVNIKKLSGENDPYQLPLHDHAQELIDKMQNKS